MQKSSLINPEKVVAILADNKYHAGQEIGDKLKITRAAVWKIITKLKNYCVPIISNKSLGYMLTQPMILLNNIKIKPLLHDQSLSLILLEKINSTNDFLKQKISALKTDTICLAEIQLAGRGRLQRQWHSPFGKNIYCSYFTVLNKDISELSGLSLIVALAICDALENVLDIEKNNFKVKWPNDIYFASAKLAGILIETEGQAHDFTKVIIGFGINVNMQNEDCKYIKISWTSLLKITEKYIDRNYLCASIINNLQIYLKKFLEYGLQKFLLEWRARDYLLNREIIISSGVNNYSGLCCGIDKNGFLQLKTLDKKILRFAAGDVTIKQIL